MIFLMIFAKIIISMKNWLFLPLYWFIWIIDFVVGRYVTCRHCEFLGQPCPTWCMGIIGGKLYKRSNKKSFTEIGLWKFFVFDVLFIFLAIIFPYIVYVYSFIIKGSVLIDWMLLIIYSIIVIVTLKMHSSSCKKCPIEGCPLK
jgi:hypothetical protein